MSDCIFCKIIANQAPAYKVYEDGKVVAFLDTKPFTDGHTLIIPKRHYQDILDIPEDYIESIARAARNLAHTYKIILRPAGFNIRQSSGVAAHQDVFHYHMHLVPRYRDDGLELRGFGQAKRISTLIDVYKKLQDI